MQRTVKYFTALSGSEKIFFTNEDLRPSGITNVRQVGQEILETKYHEIGDYPETLALWQFDQSLTGEGPEATDMQALSGDTHYTPGPVAGRWALVGYKNRSYEMTTTTASLQITGSVTYMALYNPYEDGVPTQDGGSDQNIFALRGVNSLNNNANNPLISNLIGTGGNGPGTRTFWRDSSNTNTFNTPEPRRMSLNKNWNHHATTFNADGTVNKFYINGVLVSTLIANPSAGGTNTRPRCLGPQTNDVAQAAGAICSFIIIGRTLTDSEIYKAAKMTLGDSI